MTDEYTPSTEEVRRRYHKAARSDIGMSEPQWKTNPEFDRWLASIQEPIEVTDAMVEAAWREWSNAPFPSKASLTKARAALTAALNTMKEEQ